MNDLDVAIIGMAGRFPGADNVERLWENLCNDVESVTFFDDAQLTESGVSPAVWQNPSYVKASAVLDDIESFDPFFFGYSPAEAAMMDPQHRLFMECAWEAMENAGYNGRDYEGLVGVFGGTGMNTYVHNRLSQQKGLMQAGGGYHVMVASDKDFLATKTSYKLNLKGPSMTIQTACSTSLVAVHVACQSLRNGECDMALAGGVSLRVPQKAGYMYQEGIVLSPDGHCRAFDEKAAGTVIGNGAGMVVLKLLSDALEQGDNILAVIKGSAINNDGSRKAGYTAPGLEAQAEVISEAQGIAGVSADTISYIETHGTGTPIGDPIEISALTKAFRYTTDKNRFCAIGSIKTNIGHLDAAAGVTGLIKTVLALKHKKIPKSLNFVNPNPRIDFENSPFYVNTSLCEWDTGDAPRRAGVSSFGIGGTNAHVVLEEAPAAEARQENTSNYECILLSAKTESALNALREKLAEYLSGNPDLSLSDVAYTLKVGRQSFDNRLMVMASTMDEAVGRLKNPEPPFVLKTKREKADSSVIFMFTGQGSQYAGMGRELYENVPFFAEIIDKCSLLLAPYLGLELKALLFPSEDKKKEADEKLAQTAYTQPALFVLEYALASLLIEWGIKPKAMIGHSIGEYTAAVLAGVFDLHDALKLVATRGMLMQHLPAGTMLAVSLTEKELLPLLPPDVSIGVINSPSMCVASGVTESIEKLQEALEKRNIPCRCLHTSHAFHSIMMEEALEPFLEVVNSVKLSVPQIPYISNVSGTWIKTGEATDPGYWVKHLRQTVRFSEGVSRFFSDPEQILLEVGPGKTLSTLVMQNREKNPGQLSLSTLPGPKENQSSELTFLTAIGRLWLGGYPVDWERCYSGEIPKRVPLVTYPFERQRYWFDAVKSAEQEQEASESVRKKDMSDWFYVPSWKQLPLSKRIPNLDGKSVMVLSSGLPLCEKLAEALRKNGGRVVIVKPGDSFRVEDQSSYTVRADNEGDYSQLFKNLKTDGFIPDTILHLWQAKPVQDSLKIQEEGFYGLMALTKAIGNSGSSKTLSIFAVMTGAAQVVGEEFIVPQRGIMLGELQVIPAEYPYIHCAAIDISNGETGEHEQLADRLLEEIISEGSEPYRFIAYTGKKRWVSSYERIKLDKPIAGSVPIKEKGVYIITGGLGGIGLAFAGYLAANYKAHLVLTGRNAENNPKRAGIVDELQKKGSEVMVIQADIGIEQDVQRLMSETLNKYGSVDGLIHAAGIPGGRLIQMKEREEVEKVFHAKLNGTLLLAEALKPLKPDFMVLCSSINSVAARMGQVDYAAANAFMDTFALASLPFPAVSINWETWRESGMAARMGKKEETNIDLPLLDKVLTDTNGRHVFSTRFTMLKQWELHEHGVMGKPTLPGTTYLEMARSAFSHVTGCRNAEFSDVYFLKPLILDGDEEATVETVLQKKGDGYYFVMSSGQAEHAKGFIHALSDDVPADCDIKKLKEECSENILLHPLEEKNIGLFRLERKDLERAASKEKVVVDALIVEDESGGVKRTMEFGARWHNLDQVWLGERKAIAWFELPEKLKGEVASYGLHPALLDFATSYLRLFRSEGSYLPLSYKKLSLYRVLPDAFYSYARFTDNDDISGKTITCDITLVDGSGVILVEIKDFTVMRVDDVEKLGAQSSITASETGTSNTASKLDEMIRLDLALGLSDEEGLEVFERILSSGLKRVVVSTRELEARIRQNNRFIQEMTEKDTDGDAPKGPKHPRPALYTEYAAPRNQKEKLLAEIWQEVLGIEQVGVHDNFFELGGDSLLIAKVHAAFKEKAGEEVSVAQLIQHPTIADFIQSLQQDDSKQDIEKQQVAEKASIQKAAIKKQRDRLKMMRG